MKLLSLMLLCCFLAVSCQEEKTEEEGGLDLSDFAPSNPSPPPAPASPVCSSTSKILSHETVNGGSSFFGGTDYTNFAQEISFASTVTIKSIEINVLASHANLLAYIDLRSHILTGSPVFTNPSLGRATATDFSTAVSGLGGWVVFEFPVPVVLTAGSYIYDLTADLNEGAGEDIIVWGEGGFGADGYPGHDKWRKNEYGFSFSYSSDYAFRINACN